MFYPTKWNTNLTDYETLALQSFELKRFGNTVQNADETFDFSFIENIAY